MSIKLIAVDMDGTFLSDAKTYNRPRFLAQYQRMREQNIRFVVASVNQYYQLISFFPEIAHQIAFVAENGGWVVSGNEDVFNCQLPVHHFNAVVDHLQTLPNIEIIACGKRSAYTLNRYNDALKTVAAKYYHRLELVDDFNHLDDTILKFGLNVALIAPLLGPLVGAAWVHILPGEMMFVLFAVLAAISFFGLQRAMPETATRLGEKLSVKELGRDYRLVLKNLRFVAGALATGFVSLPLLAWIAQSPVIIISGEQATSYEYGMLQVPIFGALIAGNLVLARLTARRTVRSLIIMGGWPIMFGLILSAAATVVS